MRKLIIGAFVAGLTLAGGYAAAQIVSGLPFVLQNNTLADATQVMADFNQIVNNVNANAAKNGANNDITSLNALSTPISPAQGGTTTWLGATSGGSPNMQTVASTTPAIYSVGTGRRVVFIAGFSNTGPTSLNVNGTGVMPVIRNTQLGIADLTGGEIVAGVTVEVVVNGTNYQLIRAPDYVGQLMDYVGATAPAGWAMANGDCVSQSGTAIKLFALAGTAWGACGAGLFALPDLRGRNTIAPDGGANRVTNAGSGCTATLATGCGVQNQSFTLVQGNLPSYTLPNTLGINNTMAVSNGTLTISNTMGVNNTLGISNTMAVSNGTLAISSTLGASNGTLAISNTMAASNGTLAISNTMNVSDTRAWQTSNAIFPSGAVQGYTAGATTGATAAQQAVVVASGAISLTGGTSLTGAVSLTGGTSLTGAVALTGGISLIGSVSLTGGTSLTGAVALTGGTSLTGSVDLTGSTTVTGSVTSGGSGTAVTVTTLAPALVVNKIIKL